MNIKGRELDKLRDIALDVSKILQETEGTTEITSGTDESSNEIRIELTKKNQWRKD